MKILITLARDSKFYGQSTHWVVSRMRQILGDQVEIIVPDDASETGLLRVISDVDIVLGRLGDNLVTAAKNLKFIQTLSAGIDTYSLTLSMLEQRGIKFCTAVGANDVAVAEQAITLLLACAKKVVPRHFALQRDEWDKSLSIQVRGKMVGIFGLGMIGAEVAKMARCLGMRVAAVKKRPDHKLCKELGLEWLGSFQDLNRLLSESDFIVVSTASTPETRGSITFEKLKQMKPTAYLIIISRGNIVDEDGLLQALNHNIIAGAAIDVWWQYPPKVPSLKGLNRHPRVTCASHIGGDTQESAENLIMMASSNIKTFIQGKEPINQVSAEKGY